MRVMGNRVVIKFGGADLATGEKIRRAAEMVLRSGFREIVVVVSAMEGDTNRLVEVVSQIGNVPDEDYAEIVSMGERTSARLFCSALGSLGADAVYLEPSHEEWPILTDSDYLDASADMDKTCERVGRYMEPLLGKKIIVVCGFLGRDESGSVTTLGRGGSDTTAMVLGNCLRAEEVILVKETEGVMSADPKIVPEAKPLEKLDIQEMFALAYGGARIVKADALKYKLPSQKLRIVNFTNGLQGGTEVTGVFNASSTQIAQRRDLLAVSIVCEITSERLGGIFSSLRDRPIYGISTGRGSLTIFTSSENAKTLINDLHSLSLCKALSARSGIGMVELTHPVFIDSPGWIAKVSGALASKSINIIEITTSKATISIFVDESKIEDAVNVLRDALEA